jgi:hypothetical protein
MKLGVCIFAMFVGLAVVGHAQPTEPSPQVAGTYCWNVIGSTWTLTLRVSGDYDLTTCASVPGSIARPIESGRWKFEGFTLVLKSEKRPVGGRDYRHLSVLKKKSGRLMLVSPLRAESYIGGAFGKDEDFDFVFLEVDDPARIPAEPGATAQRP